MDGRSSTFAGMGNKIIERSKKDGTNCGTFGSAEGKLGTEAISKRIRI